MNYPTSNLKLISTPKQSNWNITYSERSGYFYAIAKPDRGAESSHFGRIGHIRMLVRQGHFKDSLANLTEYGRELLSQHGIK